jgi:hypothetical protein
MPTYERIQPVPGAPDPGSPASPGLRSNRDFQAVLAGQAVSAFGDAISITAMRCSSYS